MLFLPSPTFVFVPVSPFFLLLGSSFPAGCEPEQIDLQPEAVAAWRARPRKVTLLPGQSGLEANTEPPSKQGLLVKGRLEAANTRVCVGDVCLGARANWS